MAEMAKADVDIVEARRVTAGVAAGEFRHEAWAGARPVALSRYWSGAEAPAGRHAEARLLWDAEGLTVRFVCRQEEPLVVSAAPRLDQKTMALWDRDVCEIFLTPEAGEIESYFEFEAAPTGEWIDLRLRVLPDGRETDWDFHSGMSAAACVKGDAVIVGMRIPWGAIGRVPRAGELWRANLFRCVGEGEGRGYLAWRPTHTHEPGFHVPERFGRLRFGG